MADKLAIDGGKPVRSTVLDFAPPVLGQKEIDAVVRVMKRRRASGIT